MEEIKRRLTEIIKALFDVEIEPEVVEAPQDTGADYASNVAMRLAGQLKMTPRAIAEQIQDKAKGAWQVEIAGPGFLNFISPDEYYFDKIAEIAQNGKFCCRNISCGEYEGKTVVTEFSDPNPFKVLHVGHLYTSVVGDSISRLLELAGAKVVRTNFGGDVGLHVGKTIWAMLHETNENAMTIEDIARCYVDGTRAYDDDKEAHEEITQLNKVVYALAELGEDKCRERLELEKIAEDFEMSTAEIVRVADLYWRGRTLSYDYFKDFYARIGLKFDKFYPESSVAGRGLKEVREHIGDVYEKSDGAVVYKGEKVGLHTRVFINREGVPTYETKDVGLIFTKWDDWHFDESVVITGNEQTDYMKVVLASVNEYAPELVERTRHLTHGLVKLPGSVKMSSRKGNFLRAVDVINVVQEELAEESSDGADEIITLAAIKYAFLKYKMGGDIVFDPKESVSTTGNSGVYLLYSTVRAKKILRLNSANYDVQKSQVSVLVFNNPFVRKLGKKIVQHEEVLKEAVVGKAPYKLCNYLYELSQEFSRFYENVKVAGSEQEAELMMIVKAYTVVMVKGLELLGIEVPEEM